MPLSSDPADFEDPLENYEAPPYGDALEQALAEHKVSAIQSVPFATTTPEASVAEAVEILANLHGGCLLVEKDGKLAGVITDRDVVDKVALEYDDMKARPVSTVMTYDPVFVYQTDTLSAALSVMAVSGYRYVPVVDREQRIRGIVSPQRVTGYLRRVFDAGIK
ncbi:MAG: CBS domain-containing protein [Planctomycetota bacterium]